MKAKRILLVESDLHLRNKISLTLVRGGYLIIEPDNSKEALILFKQYSIDLVLMDFKLPDSEDWILCHHITANEDIPIIMISHSNDEKVKLLGFSSGAEDYIVKPFYSTELLAQIRVVFRRYQKNSSVNNQVINVDQFSLNPHSREVHCNDNHLSLSRREYDLLEHLMVNQNIVFSREQLLDSIWGIDYAGETPTVDTHIKKLRDKLDPMSRFFKLSPILSTIKHLCYTIVDEYFRGGKVYEKKAAVDSVDTSIY